MSDLNFIKDEDLHSKVENSIEYIYALYEQSKADGQNKLYQEETYRVIVLYIVSVIEAILLYFYKVRGEKITYLEYKFPQALLPGYQHLDRKGLPVVIAVQEKVEKKEHQLGIHELVKFFSEKRLIKVKTAESILEMNDVRNTFHFNKPRAKNCDLEKVEAALSLLVHTLENAPAALIK